MSEPAAVVLVHGAWAGAWIWQRVLPLLEERGVEAHAVDLPSCGAGAVPPVGLRDDEEAVGARIDAVGRDVVVCGHSYGGMVVTGAAHGRSAVRRLVYLCAFMPDEGTSLLGALGGEAPSFWRIADDLSVTAATGTAAPVTDLSEADVALVAGARVPQSLGAYAQPPRGIAWRTVPSTYVVCTGDHQLPVAVQRDFARRATDVEELPTAHHPMLSRPELVAELLARHAGTPS